MAGTGIGPIPGLRYADVCPVCGSKQIEGGSMTSGRTEATQKVRCNECDAVWLDHYDYANYTLLNYLYAKTEE